MALNRFTSCVLQSGVELPYRAVRANIADALQLLLHLERRKGKRYVAELVELQGYQGETDTYRLYTLYRRQAAELLPAQGTVAFAHAGEPQ